MVGGYLGEQVRIDRAALALGRLREATTAIGVLVEPEAGYARSIADRTHRVVIGRRHAEGAGGQNSESE